MIMDMLSIRMCRHNEGVLSMKKALCQLTADLICFLRRYLSRLKRLPELIGNHFIFLSIASVHKMLILSQDKFLIC
mgnify:CR=1 FL=1